MLYRSNKWLLTSIEESFNYVKDQSGIIDGTVDEYFFNALMLDPKEIAYISENQERMKNHNMVSCTICLKSGHYVEVYENYKDLMDEFEKI